MTLLLFSVGIIVFFITVYGAVMIGGHFLRDLQDATVDDAPATTTSPPVATVAAVRPSSAPSVEREAAYRLVS